MRDSIHSLVLESNKLQDKIKKVINNHESLKKEDLIEMYFQVINVTSIRKSLNEKNLITERNSKDFKKIVEIEEYIDEKFNKYLHPILMSQLEKTIEDFKTNLKSKNTKQNSKTKNEIENQAKDFEELRQLMSTQEFINQYNKILEKSN